MNSLMSQVAETVLLILLSTCVHSLEITGLTNLPTDAVIIEISIEISQG